MKKLILFDLDGTLTDSGPGVCAAVAYTLQRMGYPEHASRDLLRFVGPPLVEELIAATGCSRKEAEAGTAYFHEAYDDKEIYNNSVYPGIPWMLRDLKQAGCILGIASSKPENMVVQVLEHFGLLQYFDFIAGAPADRVGGAEKAEVLEHVIQEAGFAFARNAVVLVGDRKYDVYGAGKCGVTCVGVTYGYGGRTELVESGADYVVDNVPELNGLLLQMAAAAPADTGPAQMTRGMSVGAKIWDILFPVIYMLVGNIVAGIAAAAVLMLTTTPGNLDQLWSKAGPYTLAAMGVFNLFTIFFIGRIYRRDNFRFRDIYQQTWGGPRIALAMLMMVALSHILNTVIDISRLEHVFPGYSQSAAGVFESVSLPVLTVYVGLLAPIAEELIFRGLLYRRLRAHLGIGWAIGISSALFGVFHGNMIPFLYGAALGIFLALLYERSGRILVPVLAHVFCNLFSVYGESLLQTLLGEQLRRMMPVIIIAEAAFVAVCIYILFLRGKKKAA